MHRERTTGPLLHHEYVVARASRKADDASQKQPAQALGRHAALAAPVDCLSPAAPLAWLFHSQGAKMKAILLGAAALCLFGIASELQATTIDFSTVVLGSVVDDCGGIADGTFDRTDPSATDVAVNNNYAYRAEARTARTVALPTPWTTPRPAFRAAWDAFQ
jgi:hypothetical protein